MTLCQFRNLDEDDNGILQSTTACQNQATHEGGCYGPLVCDAHRCRCAGCLPIGARRAARETAAAFTQLRALCDVADVCSAMTAWGDIRVAEALRRAARDFREESKASAPGRWQGLLDASDELRRRADALASAEENV